MQKRLQVMVTTGTLVLVISACVQPMLGVAESPIVEDSKDIATVTEGDNPLRTDIDRAMQSAANQFFSQTGHVGLSVAVVENGATHFYNYGAGLYSTTEDLANYVSWQLAERDPIVRKSHELIRGNIQEFGVGLIWDEAMVNGERRLWHSGGAFGMSSQMELFPDAKIGIVLLANDGGFDTQNQLDKAAMSVRKAIQNGR